MHILLMRMLQPAVWPNNFIGVAFIKLSTVSVRHKPRQSFRLRLRRGFLPTPDVRVVRSSCWCWQRKINNSAHVSAKAHCWFI